MNIAQPQIDVPADPKDQVIRFFPGGSNGEFGLPESLSTVIAWGEGSRVWDSNGKEFHDFTMGWGSALVGHSHPKIVEAVSDGLKDGFNFSGINTSAAELAERLVDQCPCVEKIRLVASGTEATMMCLRIARASTGRRVVLKFEGAYHGQHPVGVTSMVRSGKTDLPKPDVQGTGAPWVGEDVLVAPFNDLTRTEAIIREFSDRIAAVIVEPIHRCLVPVEGFLEGLRELTRQFGIVLVFDEVVTGFRLAPGGAQEFYGVKPDLAAYGKALGSGIPIGAYGGRSDLMACVDEANIHDHNYVWSASSTGGNPISCRAALATLDVLNAKNNYERLHDLGRKFRMLLRAAIDDTNTSGTVLGEGPMAQFAFSKETVMDQSTWLRSDRERNRRVLLELFQSGIYLNPMSTKLYVSLAHDESSLQHFIQRFVTALNKTI